MMASERKRSREATLKELQDKAPAPPAAKAKPPDAQNEYEQRIAALERANKLSTFKLKKQLTPDEIDAFDDVLAKTDETGWDALVDKLRGVRAPAQTSAPGDSTVQKPSAPPAVPASDRGGPSSPPDAIRAGDPRGWSPDQVQRIVDSAKTWAEGVKAVREQFYSGIRHLQIEFPRGK